MGWIVLAALGIGLGVAALYAVLIYNRLIRLNHAIDKAWADIDVLLKQRHDELPKLVDTVKAYMAHEREVLQRVTEARGAFDRARTVAEKWKADQQVHGALARLFAVAESYPALKADTAFRQLGERISALEESISDRRELFNHSANLFNVRIEQVPDLFLARAMGLTQPRQLFAAPEQQRRDVRISLS